MFLPPVLANSFFLKFRFKIYPRITNFDSVGGHRIAFVHVFRFQTAEIGQQAQGEGEA